MLQALRTLELDRMDEEEMVYFLSQATAIQTAYATTRLKAPAWLAERAEALIGRLETMRVDNLKRSLKSAKASLEATKTVEQKRQDLAALIADLESQIKS